MAIHQGINLRPRRQATPQVDILACIHRGGESRSVTIGCCGGVSIFSCDLHGECVRNKAAFDQVRSVENGTAVKRCDTCRDRTTERQSIRERPRLAVLVPFFNPTGSAVRFDLYEQTIAHLRERFTDVTTIQAVWPWQTQWPESDIVVQAAEQGQYLWQKECLLNVGLNAVRDRCDAVAWIDADADFASDDIEARTASALMRAESVRMFDSCLYQQDSADGEWISRARHAAGVAHACWLDLIPEGFWPWNLVGGADTVMWDRWNGKGPRSGLHALHKSAEPRYHRWSRKAVTASVPGQLRIGFHGTRKSRQYNSRYDILKRHGFDVAELTIGDNGLLTLGPQSLALQKSIISYFRSREIHASQSDQPASAATWSGDRVP